MASDTSPIGVHELEHSHQLVATHEAVKSFNDQSLTKTQDGDAIMTDQAGETAISEIIDKVDPTPTQKSFAPPSDQILFTTEGRDIVATKEAYAQERTQRAPSSVSRDLQVISKEEFIGPKQDAISQSRKENKRESKRIKEQQSSIVRLTAQANPAREGLTDAHVELQVCRGVQIPVPSLQEASVPLRHSPRQLSTRNYRTSHVQDDPQKVGQVKRDLASVRRELKISKGDLRRAQNTIKELQEKLAASQDDLTTCKDELFRLQPIAQIADSRVVKEFESLCQQVVNWIETQVAIFEKAHPENGQEYIFSPGEDNQAAQFMAQHPRGGEHLAVHMIHRWLQDNLFGRKLSCVGLPAEAIQLLERVEQSMARLDPPRDSTTIAAWRSETLKALVSTAECQETRIRENQDMNVRLFMELSKTLPILFRPQTYYSFHTQIFQPAVNLASTIKESTTRYEWSLQKSTTILKKWSPLSKACFEKNKIVDMKTGKCLKPDNLVTAAQQGIIPSGVLMIEPTLYRLNGNGQGNTLRQGTIIANLKSPLEKRD